MYLAMKIRDIARLSSQAQCVLCLTADTSDLVEIIHGHHCGQESFGTKVKSFEPRLHLQGTASSPNLVEDPCLRRSLFSVFKRLRLKSA